MGHLLWSCYGNSDLWGIWRRLSDDRFDLCRILGDIDMKKKIGIFIFIVICSTVMLSDWIERIYIGRLAGLREDITAMSVFRKNKKTL